MAVTPEIKAALDGFEIDLTKWRMKDKNAFVQAASESDESGAFPLAVKVVKAWPFEGDPTQVESYGNLDFEEWARTYKAIIAAVSLRFRGGA